MTSGFHLPPIASRVASIGQLYLYFFGGAAIVSFMFVCDIFVCTHYLCHTYLIYPTVTRAILTEPAESKRVLKNIRRYENEGISGKRQPAQEGLHLDCS